jgi:single-strand DNA-binding protein
VPSFARERIRTTMRTLNRVSLIGHLGKDPEVRELKEGRSVAHFTLATSEGFKDKEGHWKGTTDWHNLVVWGALAAFAGQHLHKGRLVYAEGKLRTRQYDTPEGQRRYVTEVIADQLILLDSK